jgi:hypothetical protein
LQCHCCPLISFTWRTSEVRLKGNDIRISTSTHFGEDDKVFTETGIREMHMRTLFAFLEETAWWREVLPDALTGEAFCLVGLLVTSS